MKKQYIQPMSELILMPSLQLLAGSLGASDQIDPKVGSREFILDIEEYENNPLILLE